MRRIFAAALIGSMLLSSLACAHKGGQSSASGAGAYTASSSSTTSAVGSYFETYAGYTSTTVTIQNFVIHTEDGQTINVPSSPVQVDLQNLQGPGNGLLMVTTNVTFPNGATSVQAAEIDVQVVQSVPAQMSGTSPTCPLTVPKTLILYASSPITIQNDSLLVQVQFSPLDDVEIASLTTTPSNNCCPQGGQDSHHAQGNNGDSDDSSCVNSAPTAAPTTALQCKLVNRRLPITQILGG